MKNRAALLIVLICTVFCYAQRAEEKIFPQQKFDPVAAKTALAKGTTTLKGKAVTRAKNSLGFKAPFAPTIFGINVTVELYPYTPYFAEWYTLKKKEENLKKNKIVYMDTEAYNVKLTTKTNNKGQFTFTNMLPGKYILVGIIPWDEGRMKTYYNGSQFDGNSGTMVNYYENQYYTVHHNDFLMRVIEIKGDQSVVNENLR